MASEKGFQNVRQVFELLGDTFEEVGNVAAHLGFASETGGQHVPSVLAIPGDFPLKT